jgi:hypothetical protein
MPEHKRYIKKEKLAYLRHVPKLTTTYPNAIAPVDAALLSVGSHNSSS